MTPEEIEALLPESMRDLWSQFKASEGSWGKLLHGHIAMEGYVGFALTCDGEAMLTACSWEEDGTRGVAEEWYVQASGEAAHPSEAEPEALLDMIANDVAEMVTSGDHAYGPDDIHPLIRKQTTHHLTHNYRRPVW